MEFECYICYVTMTLCMWKFKFELPVNVIFLKENVDELLWLPFQSLGSIMNWI